MSDELTPTEKVEPTETQPTNADVVTPPEKAEKKFTQEDVDKIINSRFAREKAAFEKQLNEQKTAVEQEYLTKQTELETQLAEKDKKLLGYAKGIMPDKLDEALVLANLKVQKDGLTLDDAIGQVAQEYPNLVTATKSGAQVVNNPQPSNPFWTDEMKRRHPDLYKKVTNK